MHETPGLTFRVNDIDIRVEDVSIHIRHFGPGRRMLIANLCNKNGGHADCG